MKYSVTITRTIVDSRVVEVEAANQFDAEYVANDIRDRELPNRNLSIYGNSIKWTYTDIKPIEKTYEVIVNRTATASRTIPVKASNESEARDIAVKKASEMLFETSDVDFDVQAVYEKK